MRSGCLNLLGVLLTALVATTLVVAGLFLLFSFAALSFESPVRVEVVLTLLVALVAIYFFVRVGVSVWRDLRSRSAVESKGTGKPDLDDGER